MTQPPEWFRAGLKRHLAELTGTTVERKLIINALAVLQAEALLRGGGVDAVDELLDDEALGELYASMSEDERNAIRRLGGGRDG
jgi:hypothetical protein